MNDAEYSHVFACDDVRDSVRCQDDLSDTLFCPFRNDPTGQRERLEPVNGGDQPKNQALGYFFVVPCHVVINCRDILSRTI